MEVLPRAEFEVMQCLWQASPPLTSRLVMDEVGVKYGWKSSTVSTFMTRLAKKGFLVPTRKGREIHYEIAISSEEYLQVEAQAFVEKYRGGSLQNLIAAFADGEDLGLDEIERLSEWLDEQKNRLT